MVLQGSLLGLAAAHRRGVVHRDFKPENVLVNGDGISKLADFGIAARSGDRPVPAGTLAYAAPEQMAGAPASPASDIYAATATFYECLTGRPPFTGDTAEMLLRQHRSEPVPLDPLPEPLRPLVAAGMAKNPAARPIDATTFVTELNTAATGAYGRHWHDHGRSHLAEAALLLAALWPSGPPPTVQGTTVQRIPLHRRIRPRRISAVKAAIAASAAIAAVAAGTALAAAGSQRPPAPAHPVAAVQPVSLQPSPTQTSQSQPSPQTSQSRSSPPPQTSPSPPSLSPAQGPPGTVVTASGTGWRGCSSMSVSGWGTKLGTAGIDGAGAFTLSFAVPSNAAPGATQLQFSPTCGHSTHTPLARFTVTQAPPTATVPAAPSNLTVTAVDPHDIRLDWQDNSGNETGFEINNGVNSKNAAPNSTSYTWGGLAPGTYMCFKIRAYNSAGDSAWEPNVSPWYQCTTTPTGSASSTVSISSTTGWQETPVSLKSGQTFTVTYASGSWSVDYRNFPYVGPGGYSEQEDAKIYQGCKIDTSETYGVLLGSVGSATNGTFPIGQGGTFAAGNNGYLYLRINDNDACLGDNSGSVTVTITTN